MKILYEEYGDINYIVTAVDSIYTPEILQTNPTSMIQMPKLGGEEV